MMKLDKIVRIACYTTGIHAILSLLFILVIGPLPPTQDLVWGSRYLPSTPRELEWLWSGLSYLVIATIFWGVYLPPHKDGEVVDLDVEDGKGSKSWVHILLACCTLYFVIHLWLKYVYKMDILHNMSILIPYILILPCVLCRGGKLRTGVRFPIALSVLFASVAYSFYFGFIALVVILFVRFVIRNWSVLIRYILRRSPIDTELPLIDQSTPASQGECE
jgi:hypothetical protein